jgi:hypothetical protein
VLFGYTNLSGLSTRRLIIHSKAKGKETDDRSADGAAHKGGVGARVKTHERSPRRVRTS